MFNDEIKDKIESATAAMVKVNPTSTQDKASLDKAKKELEEGIQTTLQHQKLIRLTDHSEFSWDTVNEYEKDELAEDDDDMKHLEKAKKAAEQKAFKKQRAVASHCGSRGRTKHHSVSPAIQQIPPPLPGTANFTGVDTCEWLTTNEDPRTMLQLFEDGTPKGQLPGVG